MSIKAILIGFTASIFLGLCFELVFLFLDVAYNYLMKSYPVIMPFKQVFYIVIILPGVFAVMFSGGYLASLYAKKNTMAHAATVGLLTCAVALYATSGGYQLTFLSLVFIALAVGSAILGNLVWQKNNTESVSGR